MLRGQVWLIHLNSTVGAETQQTHPAVIVNDDGVGALPLRVVVPLIEWKDHYMVAAWMVKLDPTTDNGLTQTSAADTFQVRSVSQTRLVRQLGKLSDDELRQLSKALAMVLGISP
jgi:mRNA interferase MazF